MPRPNVVNTIPEVKIGSVTIINAPTPKAKITSEMSLSYLVKAQLFKESILRR